MLTWKPRGKLGWTLPVITKSTDGVRPRTDEQTDGQTDVGISALNRHPPMAQRSHPIHLLWQPPFPLPLPPLLRRMNPWRCFLSASSQSNPPFMLLPHFLRCSLCSPPSPPSLLSLFLSLACVSSSSSYERLLLLLLNYLSTECSDASRERVQWHWEEFRAMASSLLHVTASNCSTPSVHTLFLPPIYLILVDGNSVPHWRRLLEFGVVWFVCCELNTLRGVFFFRTGYWLVEFLYLRNLSSRCRGLSVYV